MNTSDYEQGLKYVLRILNRQMYSEQTLQQKLAKKGIDQPTSQAIISLLREKKIISDAAYADSIIRSNARYRSASTRMIGLKLQQKGIPRDLAEERIKVQTEDIPSEKERAQLLAKQWQSRKRKELTSREQQEKLGAFLLRKGFSYSIIREIIAAHDDI